MEAELKQTYIENIKYQTHLFNNLKRWLKNSIIFSSVSLLLILFGSSLLTIIGSICMVVSILACMVIGLGLKNGKDHINQMIDMIERD